MGRLPVCDEAGRWSISTEGLSLDERRALSARGQDAETQKRFAEMNANHPKPEISAAESSRITKQSVLELGRIVSAGKYVDPTHAQQDVLASARLSNGRGKSDEDLPERRGGGKER
jgi:hypothetical protein